MYAKIKESILKVLLKDEVNEERTFFGLTVLTGITAGLVAVGLHKTTAKLTFLMKTNQSFDLKTLLFGASAVFISGYVTTRFFPTTAGSGIPNIKVALAVFHGKIPFKETLAKIFTSILSLSSGMSVGREGPTVAITSGIGSAIGEFFSLSKKRIKTLVAIGSAGGIAAAFHTPIAAVIFTLEEVVGDLNATKVLGPIIISAVAASITAQVLHDGQVFTFSQVHYSLTNKNELFFYLIIGLAASVLGPLWVKTTMSLRSLSIKTFKGHKLSLIMVSFLLIALISQFAPEVLGSGHRKIEQAILSLLLDWKVLITVFAFKFIATAISYGSGISGGLFMPTLLMGATLGALVGSFANEFFPMMSENIGAYAVVGMGAFFVSVIRAPFTSIIMIFELTRDYNIILPLMIANIVSYVISNKFHSGSVYESISEQDGIHLPTKNDNEILDSLTVEDAMIDEVKTLSATVSVKDVYENIKRDHISGYPVMSSNRIFGMVSSNEIVKNFAKGEKEKLIGELSEKKVISIYPDQSLMVALHKLKRFHVSRLPVVSRLDDRRLIGIITAENIVSKFGYHIAEEEDEDIEKMIQEADKQIEIALEASLEEQKEEHTISTSDQTNS